MEGSLVENTPEQKQLSEGRVCPEESSWKDVRRKVCGVREPKAGVSGLEEKQLRGRWIC